MGLERRRERKVPGLEAAGQHERGMGCSARVARDDSGLVSFPPPHSGQVEAMRLFVRTLEEEQPNWWGLQQQQQTRSPKQSNAGENDEFGAAWTGSAAAGGAALAGLRDEGPITGVFEAVLPSGGVKPTPRYDHAACVVGSGMLIHGGNCSGRYLGDTWIFDTSANEWRLLGSPSTSASDGEARRVSACPAAACPATACPAAAKPGRRIRSPLPHRRPRHVRGTAWSPWGPVGSSASAALPRGRRRPPPRARRTRRRPVRHTSWRCRPGAGGTSSAVGRCPRSAGATAALCWAAGSTSLEGRTHTASFTTTSSFWTLPPGERQWHPVGTEPAGREMQLGVGHTH